MARPLGLHHITTKELEPIPFVRMAAEAGYDQVSLFTNAPLVPQKGREAMFAFPTVTPQLQREMLACLAETGIKVTGAEFFLITPDADLETYRPGLAVGAALGAGHAVTHVFDTDKARAVDKLGAFCDLATEEGLKAAIEFCPMTAGCPSLAQAVWYVDQVGRNIGFGICPMHTTRSGGTPADLAALDPKYFVFGQINDGKGCHASAEYFQEVHDRELPGDGDFPLHELLSALPAHIPIEVKIPADRRVRAGIPALDYARAAWAKTRPLLDGLKPIR